MGKDISTYDDLPQEAHEAVHAARDHAQAVEIARQIQVNNIGDIMQERLENVLARGTEQEKSIVLARVPYICQDIKNINTVLEDIKKMMEQAKVELITREEKIAKTYVNQDQFSPVRMVVYGLVGLVLTGFAAALLTLIIK